MEQLSLDYSQTVEEVIRQEGTVMTGEQLFYQGEKFYSQNGALLAAHVRAANVFDEAGAEVPPKFLTELARRIKQIGVDGMVELALCYTGVEWQRDEKDDVSISNNTTPWLGRYLADRGFKVDIRKSKIDPVWERNYGVA